MIRIDFLFREDIKSTVIIAPEKYASSTVMPTKKTIFIIVILSQTEKDMKRQYKWYLEPEINCVKQGCCRMRVCAGEAEERPPGACSTAAYYPDSDFYLPTRFKEKFGIIQHKILYIVS